MKRNSARDEYVKQALRALVAFVGLDAVKTALADIEGAAARSTTRRSDRPAAVPLPKAIVDLQQNDPERFAILRPFFERIGAGELLRQSEDVRRFAEELGVKQLSSKRRRDLVAQITPTLATFPIHELAALLHRAESISEEERVQGYSVLTDRILRRP